tara:strand:- start:470 stop:850 length:381 start_codon:yes stop_codon:yes gene_type:complete
MSLEYKVEIISPDKTIFSGNSDEVILPCFEGEVTVLKDHIPLITFLRPGLIQIGKDNKFYVEEGTVEFINNNLLILSATTQRLVEMKIEIISKMIADAEKSLSQNQINDKQKYFLNHKIDTLKQIN